jgi:hypothetical protein
MFYLVLRNFPSLEASSQAARTARRSSGSERLRAAFDAFNVNFQNAVLPVLSEFVNSRTKFRAPYGHAIMKAVVVRKVQATNPFGLIANSITDTIAKTTE